MRIDDRYNVRLVIMVIVYTLSIMLRLVVHTKVRVKEGSFVGSLAAGS